MFISIYFKTSSCDSDPEINTFIYGPPPSINSAPVSSPRWTASDWTHVSRAPQALIFFFLLLAVGGNWSLKSKIGCWSSSYSFPQHPSLSFPPFSPSSSGFHLPALLVTGSYMAVIHDKQSAQPTADWEKHMPNKCKWPLVLSWASSLSTLRSLSHRFWRTYLQKCITSFLWNIDAVYM